MILEPLNKEELEKIFDVPARQVIQYFLEKTLMLQPELKPNQEVLPIQIPKEHIEQWFVQALNAQSVGAGSYPVDILMPNQYGADVKMLSCVIDANDNLKQGSLSGETSLAQKFQGTGINLDSLFKNKQYEEILDGWKKILYDKLCGVMKERNVTKIYYFFFLRAGTTFYICGCRVNPSELGKASVNLEKSNNNNVWVDNFIDSNYGKITIYKAKKRMELRLFPYTWKIHNKVIEFPTKQNINRVDLRELAKDNGLSEYIKENFKSMIN